MKKVYNLEKRAKKEKKLTADGSYTLYSAEFDECYHSLKDGALQEALKKHIEVAFEFQKEKTSLNILDICFGLGYNTFATVYFIKRFFPKKRVNIISPEFDIELVKSLKDFSYPKEFEPIKDIIYQVSQNGFYKDENIKIEILFGDAREILPKLKQKFDIVYQDAFSPKKNPLLWTREYFETIKAISSEDIIITTYSIATPVRVALWESGFLVYEYPNKSVRRGTVASLKPLDLKEVDIELKLQRNKEARSLRDRDFME